MLLARWSWVIQFGRRAFTGINAKLALSLNQHHYQIPRTFITSAMDAKTVASDNDFRIGNLNAILLIHNDFIICREVAPLVNETVGHSKMRKR